MKILQIINNLSTGGAEKLILESIPLLKERGVLIDLLVLDHTQYPYMKELQELNCCTIFSLNTGSLYNPVNILRIIPYFKKYDIVHVHLFPAQYWVGIAKFISFSKTKLIFTEHNTSNKRLQNPLFKILDKNIYRFYDEIICITNEVKEVLLKHCKFKEKNISVIENGINLTAINAAKIIPKKQIDDQLLESDKLLIQIAGFRVQKDHKTVIRSLQYLNFNVKLLLVGDGDLRKDCEKLVDELNLKERVFFLGVRIDVPTLLKTSDISIISSHWEGFGLAAVEGMAVAKPILASNVEGLAKVVTGGGILFEKGNEIELAKKIQELLDDHEFYDKISNRCFERAKEFNIDIMINKQINLYKRLLNKY